MISAAWRNWWLPALIMTISGLLQFGAPRATQWLRLEPAMIRNGELWRLLSGQLVHLSWGHFLMNGIALMAICGLYQPWLSAGLLAWWMFVSAIAVGVGLLWLEPMLGWYVGLSGVLHGLVVAGALRCALKREPVGFVLLTAVILKLAWEQTVGPMPGSEIYAGGKVIVNAHVYGAVGGIAAVASQRLFGFRLMDWRASRR